MLPRFRASRTAFPLLGFSLFALWGCFSDSSPSPTSPDTIQELQLKGSISGTVTDSVGTGISGVAVTLDSGGFATNTDSLGRYTIPDVPGRTWTVRFTKVGWHDTALAGLVLAIDEDRKGVDARMRLNPIVAIENGRKITGAAIYTGTAYGAIYDSFQISSAKAIGRNVQGDTLFKSPLSWNGQSYNGSLPILGMSGTLKVLLLDSAGVVSADTTVSFKAADSGLLTIPAIHAGNNLPYVRLADAYATIGSSVTLHALAGDRRQRPIVRYEWSVNGQPFQVGGKDTTIQVPATAKSSFPVTVRVLNSDGIPARASALVTVAAGTGLVDSRDGRSYPVVTIGKQTWMAQNLAFKTDSSWTYENNADTGAKYGRLYTWAAAMALPDSCNLSGCADLVKPKHQGACPSNWHVPTPAEWTYLTDTVQKADSSATRLRATSGWNSVLATYDGTDRFGFDALPGGLRDAGTFDNSGTYAWFRTASPDEALFLMPFQAAVQRTTVLATAYGYSVRCVKD